MGRPGPARYAGPSRRVYTIGVAGPVGASKTALVETLCRALWPEINLAVITNDVYDVVDARGRRVPLATRGAAGRAHRRRADRRLPAYGDPRRRQRQSQRHRQLPAPVPGPRTGPGRIGRRQPDGRILARLADLFIFVIDVAEGDKIPRKAGPSICNSDLLVINKIDLAPHVGADLDVMRRDSLNMRGERPFLMVSLRQKEGVEEVIRWVREQFASRATSS
jgi:urease accessory protein